jgi:hypothetical protein
VFRRLGRPGDYLTGIVCVVAYVVSIAVVAPVAFGETLAETKDDWLAMLVISTFFGLIVGHTWFRPDQGGAHRRGAAGVSSPDLSVHRRV